MPFLLLSLPLFAAALIEFVAFAVLALALLEASLCFFLPLLVVVVGDEAPVSSCFSFTDLGIDDSGALCCCCFCRASCSFFSCACSAAFLAASSRLTCHILTFGGPEGSFGCSVEVEGDEGVAFVSSCIVVSLLLAAVEESVVGFAATSRLEFERVFD